MEENTMKFTNKVGGKLKNSIKMKEEEKIKPHRRSYRNLLR